MRSGSIEVEFFEISDSRSVLDEVEALLTSVQLALFTKNIQRLEKHGRALDGSYFGRIRGSKEPLEEYRLSLDKVELRLLFAEVSGVIVMLSTYKEKRNDVPDGAIRSAEARLKKYRETHK
jgi:hypothetical protein